MSKQTCNLGLGRATRRRGDECSLREAELKVHLNVTALTITASVRKTTTLTRVEARTSYSCARAPVLHCRSEDLIGRLQSENHRRKINEQLRFQKIVRRKLLRKRQQVIARSRRKCPPMGLPGPLSNTYGYHICISHRKKYS